MTVLWLIWIFIWIPRLSSNNSKIIKSVHLLGATIDNELIANNTPFGNAIEHVVDKFYNLYSSQDDGLEFNEVFEKHNPLGLVGAPSENCPINYNETNVTEEIPPLSDADGDGNLEECFEEYQTCTCTEGTITADISALDNLFQLH